jgi:hypothetical protein
LGDTGLEHNAKTPDKPIVASQGGAKSGAVEAESSYVFLRAGELQEVITGWAELPAAIKTGILAMVRASKQGSRILGN